MAKKGLESPLLLVAEADEPVARLPGLVITRRQFLEPLIESHGLPVMINVVQLELVKQNAKRMGLQVTPEELRAERERTVEQAFTEADNKTQDKIDDAIARGDTAAADQLRQDLKRDRERALDQYLAQQRVSRSMFDLLVQTRAYLRKIAEKDMREISDDVLRKAFDTEYGATVRVRHIQAINRQDLARAQERLKTGEPFEKVAREMSGNARTAPLGGELPKFSLATTNIPANFKEAAFALAEGQVSNVIECDGVFHVIKLEQKFSPRAVKFESVKESLREKVKEQVLQGAIGHLQEQLGEQMRATLVIEDPVLRGQFARRVEEYGRQIKEMDKIREQQERERRTRRQSQPAPAPPRGAAPGTVPGAAPGAVPPAVDPQKVLPVPGAGGAAQPPKK